MAKIAHRMLQLINFQIPLTNSVVAFSQNDGVPNKSISLAWLYMGPTQAEILNPFGQFCLRPLQSSDFPGPLVVRCS